MEDKNKLLCDYFKENDPTFWKTIGKDFNNPTVIMNELIRHYQWIYFMGDIDSLDFGAKENKYYKIAFIEILARNQEFRQDFLNYFFSIFKIAYDYENDAWYRDVVISILVKNKRLFWFDYTAMYALICSSYRIMRYMIVHDFEIDESIGIKKESFIKLLDGISNQAFYDDLKSRIKLERKNCCKNNYH